MIKTPRLRPAKIIMPSQRRKRKQRILMATPVIVVFMSALFAAITLTDSEPVVDSSTPEKYEPKLAIQEIQNNSPQNTEAKSQNQTQKAVEKLKLILY